MPDAETLRARLARKPIVVAPGVYDPFTALMASQAGFSTLYVSGAAIAYTRLGRPDIGLVSMSEVAATLALIGERVDAHLIVDADTGYGNALNVVRTVRAFERAGADAIQLEDQDFPKRCGHLDGKALIPAPEMCGKIRAAVDTRHSRETLIAARTDAVADQREGAGDFRHGDEPDIRPAEAGIGDGGAGDVKSAETCLRGDERGERVVDSGRHHDGLAGKPRAQGFGISHDYIPR
jgi:2-methylisocitrate lyase-like PEP mutase family enzyme